jgi:hypothetical protein
MSSRRPWRLFEGLVRTQLHPNDTRRHPTAYSRVLRMLFGTALSQGVAKISEIRCAIIIFGLLSVLWLMVEFVTCSDRTEPDAFYAAFVAILAAGGWPVFRAWRARCSRCDNPFFVNRGLLLGLMFRPSTHTAVSASTNSTRCPADRSSFASAPCRWSRGTIGVLHSPSKSVESSALFVMSEGLATHRSPIISSDQKVRAEICYRPDSVRL